MKKVFLLTLLISFYFKSQSQDYKPLAIENAKWIYVITDEDGSSGNPPAQYYGFIIEGDTIINNVTYKKLYKRGFGAVNNDYQPPLIAPDSLDGLLYGAVRDDILEEKVYGMQFCESIWESEFCTSCDEEFLMYDFSLNEGDILYDEDFCVFNSDSGEIEISNIYYTDIYDDNRKVQESIVSVIEGIGVNSGDLFQAVPLCLCGSDFWGLVDYCVGDDQDCFSNILLNNDEFSLNKVFSIYPNPSNNFLNVKSNIQFNDNLKYSIKDVLGKNVVLNLNLINSKINVSYLKNGIYILKIHNNHIAINKKFIKN